MTRCSSMSIIITALLLCIAPALALSTTRQHQPADDPFVLLESAQTQLNQTQELATGIMLGLPSEDQLKQAIRAWSQVVDQSSRASLLLDDLIDLARNSPDLGVEVQSRFVSLADLEWQQEVQAAGLSGTAGTWSLLAGSVRPDLTASAAGLEEIEFDQPESEISRLLALGLLAQTQGKTRDAASLIARAARMADQIQISPKTKANTILASMFVAPTTDQRDAIIKKVQQLRHQQPFSAENAPRPDLVQLSYNAITRVLLDADNQRDTARALQVQQALASRTGLAPDQIAHIQSVLTSLGNSVAFARVQGPVAPFGELARAQRILLHNQPLKSTLTTRLDEISQSQTSGPWSAWALWQLARNHQQNNNSSASSALLIRLAEEHPRSILAKKSIESAIVTSRSLWLDNQQDSAARNRLNKALRLGLTHQPDASQADPWRLALAWLIKDDQPLDALNTLHQITTSSSVRADAQPLHQSAMHNALTMLWNQHQRSLEEGKPSDQVQQIVKKIASVIASCQHWLDSDPARQTSNSAHDYLAFNQARVLIELGQTGALDLLRTLPKKIQNIAPTQQLMTRARAMLIAGDQSGAFAQLRALGATLESQTPRPVAYWQAWTLMLEILSDQNSTGDRSGTIRIQIARLRALDPTLNGEPWASRINRVQDASQ